LACLAGAWAESKQRPRCWPAALDADSRRGRFQTARTAAGRRNGDGPRSHRYTRCCAKKAWLENSWSSTHRAFESHASRPRATIANMAPEYGATMGFFPVDAETLAYLRFYRAKRRTSKAGRKRTQRTGTFPHGCHTRSHLSDRLELNLATVVPTMAGPKRPQDSVFLTDAKSSFEKSLGAVPKSVSVQNNGDHFELSDGSVVIAAITSCTNTSNPSLMLEPACWRKSGRARPNFQTMVKTSFAPGLKLSLITWLRLD